AATITIRPWPWLAVRNVLAWRSQRTLSALDFLGETAVLAGELVTGRERATLRYELDHDWLAGAAYLLVNRADIAYRHEGEAVAIVASYGVQRRDFAQTSQQPFTGWVHASDVGVVFHLGAGTDVEARLTAGRESTVDRSFANLSAGGA